MIFLDDINRSMVAHALHPFEQLSKLKKLDKVLQLAVILAS